MSTLIATTTADADQQDLRALAADWPQFSSQELRRLYFQVYRRRMGRIRPPTPVSAEADALCASLLAGAGRPGYAAPPPNSRDVPLLWATWLEQQRARHGGAAA